MPSEAKETPTTLEFSDPMEISTRRRAVNTVVTRVADALLEGIQRHWLAGVNTLLGVFIGVALLTPLGYALGWVGPSNAIFSVYHYFCAQTPSHSFYIEGYQVCLCARCLAIYTSLLTGGLLLALFRTRPQLHARIPHIGWRWWLLGMIPMALDGGTQLFGWHESNVFLRLLTGGIFGLMTAWFLFMQINESSKPTQPTRPAAVGARRR